MVIRGRRRKLKGPLACLILLSVTTLQGARAEEVPGGDGKGPSQHITVYDLRYTLNLSPAAAYEEAHLYSALSGLANRDKPALYALYNDGADQHWLDYMRQRPFLMNATVSTAASLDELLDLFSHAYRGAVLYDPEVPASSNVASTTAGALDLLPIAYRPQDPTSLYSRYITGEEKRLPVALSLVGLFNTTSTPGSSAKAEAYRWAIENLLRANKTDPAVMAYFVDYYWTKVPFGSGKAGTTGDYRSNTVVNHDYFIAKRAFFWDLNVWDDEPPNDEPSQVLGTDLKTLVAILQAHYEATGGTSVITVGGFTPWLYKYVGWKHEGVETEWQAAMILSAYNVVIDADACCIAAMPNAALYQHYPLPERLVQRPAPTPQALMEQGLLTQDPHTGAYSVPTAGYYAFYVGDYDSAAWMYGQLYDKWDDPARGKVPLGWAFNPNLARRFPLIFDHAYATLTDMDRITTGDSGPGYINPTMLFEPRDFSHAPSGTKVWRDWCVAHYNRFGLTFTGFLLNGKAGNMSHETQQLYTEFSWDGMTNHFAYSPSFPKVPSLEGNTPVFEETNIPGGNVTGATTRILDRYHKNGGGHQFLIFRSILQSPSYHWEVVNSVTAAAASSTKRKTKHHGKKEEPVVLRAVDPLTLSYLARVHLGGHNNDRVQYIHDTVPRTIEGAAGVVEATFTVRNNGWNTLPTTASTTIAPDAAATTTTTAADIITLTGSLGDREFTATCNVAAIPPGADGVFHATIPVPEAPGDYVLRYGLRRGGGGGDGDFSRRGNPVYIAKCIIKTSIYGVWMMSS